MYAFTAEGSTNFVQHLDYTRGINLDPVYIYIYRQIRKYWIKFIPEYSGRQNGGFLRENHGEFFKENNRGFVGRKISDYLERKMADFT